MTGLVVILILALLGPPCGAGAQPLTVPRIGVLSLFSPEHPEGRPYVEIR